MPVQDLKLRYRFGLKGGKNVNTDVEKLILLKLLKLTGGLKHVWTCPEARGSGGESLKSLNLHCSKKKKLSPKPELLLWWIKTMTQTHGSVCVLQEIDIH